jgi:hypothetical protein
MDFAAALKKLEKETGKSSSGSQLQRDVRRNDRGEGGGAIRGRGDGGGGGVGQWPPHAGGGGDRGRNYYGNGGSSGGDGGDRRRGRNEYDDRQRNQRPRYNNNNQRGGQGGRSDRGSGGGSNSYDGRDHSNDSRSSRGRDRSGSGGGGNSGSSSWPLAEMHRFGYHVSPIPFHRRRIGNDSILKPPADLGKRPFHIALLCICIDSLPFEHLWREWAHTGNAHVSLLVHAKYPDKIVAQAKLEEAEAESDKNRPACMVRDRLLTKPPRIGRGKSYADPEYLTHTPAWGSVQITRAMLELLSAASIIGTSQDTERSDLRFMSQRYLLPRKASNNGDKDVVAEVVDPNDIPPVDKFIFISETCIPVQTLQECEDALFGDKTLYTSLSCQEEKPTAGSEQQQSSSAAITPWEVSWVNARQPQTSPGTPRNKYERDQFQDLHAMIPIENRWKADQWHCLSRPHALAVLELDAHLRPHLQLWNSFTRINASDEMYFPTALSILGILNTKDFISSSSTTTTDSDANNPKQTPKEDSGKVALTATVGTAAVPSDAAATTTTTTTSSASATTTVRASSINLRPITYTDWSEGMRNPATFSKGMRDFRKIARIARQQGSLLARKFALVCPSIAAMNDSKNNNICDSKVVGEQTGQITASEWRNEVESMASDAAVAAASIAPVMKEYPEAEPGMA